MTIYINNQAYDHEQQCSDFVQKSIEDWKIGIVLCSYEKIGYAHLESLICRWACEIDKRIGKVTRSMHSQHPQRIEKAIMLEYTKNKRYWHANAVLRKPDRYSTDKFVTMLNLIWLDVLEKDQKKRINKGTDLFWGETILGGFRHYAFKKQPEDEKFVWQIRSGHEPMHFTTLTMHNSATS